MAILHQLIIDFWYIHVNNVLQQEKGGVQSLIEVENPNRVQNKMKKAGEIGTDSAKPELSRRER